MPRPSPRLYLLAAALLGSCGRWASPPKRPEAVPLTAAWAKAPTGGAWIDCHKLAGDSPRFECAIFNDDTGGLYSQGVFRPDFDPNRIELRYRSYDGGGGIDLSDTTHMWADSVNFPSADGHGKIGRFRFGDRIGEDSSY